MKQSTFLILAVFLLTCNSIVQGNHLNLTNKSDVGVELPSFVKSPYFDEQVLAYTYIPNIKVEINAPPVAEFDANLPTALVFYALPNAISTGQTIGKEIENGENKSYIAQHIGAQTRFIRVQAPGYNLVTVYMETSQQNWSTWRTTTTNSNRIIKDCVESILALFEDYNPYVVLSGHGGGGSHTFGFIDAATDIPSYVKRISFIDSNNGWDNAQYGEKLVRWLKASDDNYLSVICYNDSEALINGQPIVETGEGTWNRSRMMQQYLKQNLSEYSWSETGEGIPNAEFITCSANSNRIQFLSKTNPAKTVLHDELVEKNGYIQTLFSGTAKEGANYAFFGAHAYNSHVQSVRVYPHILRIPPRPKNAPGGAAFMSSITSVSLADRENAIYREIASGNIPNAFRKINRIAKTIKDADGNNCTVELEVLPDFLAIGSDDDFCRIPMLPATAQKIATLFGATLPTSKISDLAWEFAQVRLSPQTMTPDASMTTVPVFVAHNTLVETARKAEGKALSAPIAGIKKDIIITNRIAADYTKLYIYGWHYQNGTPIQSISGAHNSEYVDYSHGVRIVNQEMSIDGKLTKVRDVLRDSKKYVLLSAETGAMTRTEYPLSPEDLPATVKSFALIPESATSVKVLLTAISGVDYRVYYGTDINNLTGSYLYNSSNPVVDGLTEDLVYYFAIEASNENGSASLSKKLAVTPTGKDNFALLVEGFNRIVTGNTGSFVKQHAEALAALNKQIASTSNDALIAGLVNINDYPFTDWILGEESTADRTFNPQEQAIVKNYLEAGGFLYVSAAEIGWDIARAASPNAALSFANDYLKFSFVADNPGTGKGQSHKAELLPDTGFGSEAFYFNFADGSATAVEYPDVIGATGGSVGFLRYVLDNSGSTNVNYAGIAYAGTFGSSVVPGKVIVMGIPFESVVPAEKRTQLMQLILNFNNKGSNIADISTKTNVYNSSNGVRIDVDTPTSVAIYTIDGKLLIEAKISQDTEYALERGMYIIRTNEQATKIVVGF